MKKRILGPFSTKAVLWGLLMPAAVASKQEGTFRESGVRRPSYHRNHRGTGQEPGVPRRRCKNQEGRKKQPHLL